MAGLAYVADTVARGLLANYADFESIFVGVVAVPALVADGWFALWLLVKGGRSDAALTR